MVARYQKSLFLLVSLLFFGTSGALSVETYDPLLVVVLMVKNEEDVIVGTLEPFVKAHIDSYLIFDTGSTDNTVAVTKKYFEEQHIAHGYIEQEPFVDFATSRNRALRLVEEKFPHAAFMIMVDAEWYLHNVPDLIAVCEQLKHRSERSYLIKMLVDDTDNYRPLLFRCRTGVEYTGVIHEIVLDYTGGGKLPDTICFFINPTEKSRKKSYERFTRDIQLLLKELEKNPYDIRSLYCVAYLYTFLGDWDNAIEYFTILLQFKGLDEENYMAQYGLANSLENKYQGDELQWPLALAHYLKAYAMRPSRIEPLIRIASHYLAKGDVHVAYLHAFNTLSIPYPKSDVFVEREMYDVIRYSIISQVAIKVGEYEMGEFATLKALQKRPQDAVLEKNLAMYQAILK
ncbi:MAG: hypothetical protein Q8Q25_00185 [bacterium]|nr:hypothetical protein [bacterium]